jgi:hypothetical protein
MDEALRKELLAMRAGNLRVRDELGAPRVEAVHRRNASKSWRNIDGPMASWWARTNRISSAACWRSSRRR